jgi:hypothetical protein
MNITGSRDGKVFFIDDDKVMIDGKMYYEKSPQNLPKADAYSLLADVRAYLHNNSMLPKSYCVDEVVISVEKLDDFLFSYISEHFS